MEKKYDHLINETARQKKWEDEKTYAQEKVSGPSYSIDTPPPTVSGALHIGHIFSYTQTDIIARFKRMSGFSVYYPFGFDDNGLPTERFVEKKEKVRPHTMKRSEFIDLCLEATHEVEKDFKKLWQRMGLSIDWKYSYSTIDERTRKISQRSFIELYKKGFIYRKDEPALYCTACRTSVAQAELDDVEKSSTFNNIAFHDKDGNELVIGTTRPELLPSCTALLFHPDDKRYQHLKSMKAIVPLFGHEVPIIPDDMVEPDKGTGLVMCCAFGDKMDIAWIKKHQLKYKLSIGRDGKFIEGTKFIEGLKVSEARKIILKELESNGYLKSQKPISHAVNVHERCKNDIEYYSLPQWFLKVLPYKADFIKAADEINWYPSYMKSRYINWVENISWDWCLSRQRYYGIPFPAWHCSKCEEIILAQPEQLPLDPQETPFQGQCPKCGSNEIVADTDIMDTWNTSSLSPYIVMALKENITDEIFTTKPLPMSMRPQAHDIIRTWAFYTIVKAWMHEGTVPWKDIIISGHVLAGKEKISKSKDNNPLAPENLLKEYPADAIRYWTASGTLGTDISFSDNQLRIGRKLITKLWNAFKFSWQYLEEFDPKNITFDEKKVDTVNAWLLHQASTTFATYKKYFHEQEFGHALDAIEKFFWHDFCDNYIELVKDILMNQENYNQKAVYDTLYTLYTVGLRILQMYGPFVPHITESIYEIMYKNHERTDSLHQTQFSMLQIAYAFEDKVTDMSKLLHIISTIRRLKTDHQLSLKTEIATLTLHANDTIELKLARDHETLIKGISKAKEIFYENVDDAENLMAEKNNAWHAHVLIA